MFRSTIVMMALCCVAVLGFLARDVSAQTFDPSYPADHPFCDRPGFVRIDRSAWYRNGANLTTTLCVLQYYAVCATVNGAEPCNLATGSCRDVEYAWDNTVLNRASASVMVRPPQVCAGPGAYFHPEVAVYALAQPVLAYIIGFIVLVLVAVGLRNAGSLPGLWILFTLMFISCGILIFGVWYLNAYLALLVTITGMGMFASRNKSAILIGLLCIFFALLWFTYAPGLGMQQQSFRITNVSVQRYEEACNSFYKGFFADPVEFRSTFSSPLITTRGYCLRGYIAVELFFLFIIELLFLMLFAYGGYTMVHAMNHDSS